jgi:hypothetical protein
MRALRSTAFPLRRLSELSEGGLSARFSMPSIRESPRKGSSQPGSQKLDPSVLPSPRKGSSHSSKGSGKIDESHLPPRKASGTLPPGRTRPRKTSETSRGGSPTPEAPPSPPPSPPAQPPRYWDGGGHDDPLFWPEQPAAGAPPPSQRERHGRSSRALGGRSAASLRDKSGSQRSSRWSDLLASRRSEKQSPRASPSASLSGGRRAPCLKAESHGNLSPRTAGPAHATRACAVSADLGASHALVPAAPSDRFAFGQGSPSCGAPRRSNHALAGLRTRLSRLLRTPSRPRCCGAQAG